MVKVGTKGITLSRRQVDSWRDYQANIYVTPMGRWIIKLQWQNGHSHRWWQHPYTAHWGVLYPHMLRHLRVLCEPEIPNCRLPMDDKRKRHGCKWNVIKTDRNYPSSVKFNHCTRMGFDMALIMGCLNEQYWKFLVRYSEIDSKDFG